MVKKSVSSQSCPIAISDMQVYHKIDKYYGVLVEGSTVFSGSLEACQDYLKLFGYDDTQLAEELRQEQEN